MSHILSELTLNGKIPKAYHYYIYLYRKTQINYTTTCILINFQVNKKKTGRKISQYCLLYKDSYRIGLIYRKVTVI